ncbi:MAG: tripartite tricarboxylate transporter substrate binding protein [Betaproteobacteria bacterium]|nr:tripartite tricarboxylate transporter substrate binding protein [Betaproteobacteria bacterium]
MKIGNRLLRQLCNVFLSVLGASIAGAALAQPYPNKPIRIIVPAPPGGGSDTLGRPIAHKLAEAWAQTVVMDNRAGAGGNIAFELVARAAPDGYTLLLVNTPFVVNPSLYRRKLPFDPIKDFAPITQLTAQAYLFVVPPSLPAKTVKEFVALAKSKKGGLTYASSSIGSSGQLGMELFKTLAGFDAVMVPYKGGAAPIIAVIAGEVDALFSAPPGSLPHVKSGKLKALAVTSLKRRAFLPDVPTIAEAGFPGYEVIGWYGLAAPAGTPRAVVAKIYQEISRILKLPDVIDRVMADGADPVGSTPEGYAAYLKAEMIKWAKVVEQSGSKAD